MECFTLQVRNNGRWVQYPEQDGETSLALMEFMLQRGVESRAMTQIEGRVEIFNINEMREAQEAWA